MSENNADFFARLAEVAAEDLVKLVDENGTTILKRREVWERMRTLGLDVVSVGDEHGDSYVERGEYKRQERERLARACRELDALGPERKEEVIEDAILEMFLGDSKFHTGEEDYEAYRLFYLTRAALEGDNMLSVVADDPVIRALLERERERLGGVLPVMPCGVTEELPGKPDARRLDLAARLVRTCHHLCSEMWKQERRADEAEEELADLRRETT